MSSTLDSALPQSNGTSYSRIQYEAGTRNGRNFSAHFTLSSRSVYRQSCLFLTANDDDDDDE